MVVGLLRDPFGLLNGIGRLHVRLSDVREVHMAARLLNLVSQFNLMPKPMPTYISGPLEVCSSLPAPLFLPTAPHKHIRTDVLAIKWENIGT